MFTPNNQQSAPNIQSAQTSGNSSSSNNPSVPQAREALNNMKHEIASELGINLKQGYNGNLTSREAGYIGGYMVKRMIEQQEQNMSKNS